MQPGTYCAIFAPTPALREVLRTLHAPRVKRQLLSRQAYFVSEQTFQPDDTLLQTHPQLANDLIRTLQGSYLKPPSEWLSGRLRTPKKVLPINRVSNGAQDNTLRWYVEMGGSSLLSLTPELRAARVANLLGRTGTSLCMLTPNFKPDALSLEWKQFQARPAEQAMRLRQLSSTKLATHLIGVSFDHFVQIE